MLNNRPKRRLKLFRGRHFPDEVIVWCVSHAGARLRRLPVSLASLFETDDWLRLCP
jgi:hypothetical protein